MPSYLRKSFRVGHLLPDITKGGLGLSGEINDARGIYYRKNLSGGGEENVMVDKDAADRASHPYVGMKDSNG
jgi:hypothetical protein